MIDSRLLGYIALAFTLFIAYQAWMEDYGPQSTETTAVESTVADAPAQDIPQAEFSPIQSDSPQSDEKVADVPKEGDNTKPSAATELITISSDVLRLQIDLNGGTVVKADLLKYPVDLEHPDQPIHIFSIDDGFFVAQSGIRAVAAAPDHYAKYESGKQEYLLSESEDELQVPLTWTDSSGIKVTKLFTLKRGQYDLKISHLVENKSSEIWQGREYRQLQRSFKDEGNGGFLKPRAYIGGVIYSPENKYEKLEFEEMAEEPLKRTISNGWAAMIQHYFLAAWIPQRDEENQFYSLGVDNPSGQRYVLGLFSPEKTIAAGDAFEFASTLYIGPKIQKELELLATGLKLTVDYGLLTPISAPLFWLLHKIHSFVGNWGWSIIIVTLLIKALFYKLAETSYRSMANMRRVQPKMASIKERYADDRQAQSKAMMELYKKEKINPLGGCLPMVIQIPVFIALYWVLLESVELRQAPFIFWLKDLSIKDPLYVLPLIMGVSMFIQQKLNPAPVDPVQAKVFMMLPIVFTVFFAFFPAGLVLYWVINNLTTIAQQWFITKKVLAK